MSLELLLVLGAAFAFAAALLPAEFALAERARFAALEAQQALALERLGHLAREAWAGGPGTRVEAELALPMDAAAVYLEGGALRMDFRSGGRNASRTVGVPPLELEAGEAPKGRYRASAENAGGLVRVGIKAVSGPGRHPR